MYPPGNPREEVQSQAVTALAKSFKKNPATRCELVRGFWVSGVDRLVVNRAEYPLQHAMRVPSPQLCSVTGRGSVGDFCEVLPFQHIPSLWQCLAEGQDSNLPIKLPNSIPSDLIEARPLTRLRRTPFSNPTPSASC